LGLAVFFGCFISETALTAYPSNTLGETFVRYAQLSGQNILSALSESHMVISAITKYQASLASSTALPKDDTARIELTAANVKVVEKIQTEIRALEHELDRQEAAEKSRY
jgi:hypothetical protein